MERDSSVCFSELMHGRNNNLNIIRFLAALAVIWSHSFSITLGAGSPGSFLDQRTGDRLSIGGFAVAIFFFYGGILIAKSCEHHSGARSFFAIRSKRIFPQLATVVLLCTFVMGPLITELSPASYFSNPGTYAYLLNAVLVLVHPLPGVFASNPYPDVVNGALWTLPVEYACYVLCFVVFLATRFRKKGTTTVTVLMLVASLAFLVFSNLAMLSVVRAVMEFVLGMLVWTWRDSIPVSKACGLGSIFLMVALLYFGLDLLAMIVCFPYALLWLGWGTRHKIANFANGADLSYGTYLWGFPVQQLLCFLWQGEMSWVANACLACLVAVPAGYLNYRLIDKGIIAVATKRIALRREKKSAAGSDAR